MKTIRPPKNASHYELVCNNDKCAAKMECSQEELEDENDKDGQSFVLTCPHCKTRTFIDKSVIKKYAVKPSPGS